MSLIKDFVECSVENTGRFLSFFSEPLLSGICAKDAQMTENPISFFDCCPALEEDLLSVEPSVIEEQIITVRETVQSVYTYVESAANHVCRWITVTAEWFRQVIVSRVKAFVLRSIRQTGVQILRKYAIMKL